MNLKKILPNLISIRDGKKQLPKNEIDDLLSFLQNTNEVRKYDNDVIYNRAITLVSEILINTHLSEPNLKKVSQMAEQNFDDLLRKKNIRAL